MRILSTLLFVSCFILVGCEPVAYQRAVGWAEGGQNGYLDMKLEEGIYVIEVQDIGGYQQIIDQRGSMKIYSEYWHRRAEELCPDGYKGEPRRILPYQARIPAFRCNLNLCQDYPMLSGVALCESINEGVEE